MSKTIYTAIFGPYDTLKEPLVVTPGWKYVCYTDQPIKSVNWQIIQVPLIEVNQQLTARYYKIMFHRHIKDIYSMWIDGSFQINCNLDKWWSNNFKGSITCIRHPKRDCIYEEADVCIKQNRDKNNKLGIQIHNYRKVGFPKNAGLIQSGILMRECCKEISDLCVKWYDQIQKYSLRDQVSFSYIFKDYPYHLVEGFNYSSNKDFIFTKHNFR